MSVFVDGIIWVKKTRKWPYDELCHMSSKSKNELLAMAKILKLDDDKLEVTMKGVLYFNLTRIKRRRAIEHGAKEVTRDLLGGKGD